MVNLRRAWTGLGSTGVSCAGKRVAKCHRLVVQSVNCFAFYFTVEDADTAYIST